MTTVDPERHAKRMAAGQSIMRECIVAFDREPGVEL